MQKVRSQHHVQVGLVAGPGSFFGFFAFSLFFFFFQFSLFNLFLSFFFLTVMNKNDE